MSVLDDPRRHELDREACIAEQNGCAAVLHPEVPLYVLGPGEYPVSGDSITYWRNERAE